MFSLDHASLRLEDELVWLGIAPVGLAWVFQAQILAPNRAGGVDRRTHMGCEIVGYTSLKPDSLPAPYVQTPAGGPLFLRRVFYLSPDWDHAFTPDELPDDLVVKPDTIEPGHVGLMPWSTEEWIVSDDFDDDDFDDDDEDEDGDADTNGI